MAEPKKPQDHKAKEGAAFRSVTIRGLTMNIPKDALDDFELLDDLSALEIDRDGARLPRILRKLADEQFNDVMKLLRGDNGRVSVRDGSEFVKELITALNPNS